MIKPDWSLFRKHTDEYVCRSTANYAVVISYLAKFAYLPDDDRIKRLDKFTFPTVDHVPPCLKYITPAAVQFIKNVPAFSSIDIQAIQVDINALINIDHDHFLDLHPVRYDKVKEAISLGVIDMPYVSICSEGFPRIGDGRHRTIALYKFGFETIDIAVPAGEASEIVKQLSAGLAKPSHNNSFSVQDKKFSLESFFE